MWLLVSVGVPADACFVSSILSDGFETKLSPERRRFYFEEQNLTNMVNYCSLLLKDPSLNLKTNCDSEK